MSILTINFCFIFAMIFVFVSLLSFISERMGNNEEKKKEQFTPYLVGVSFFFFCIGALGYFVSPKAIDVYRGNTVLEITCVDTLNDYASIDSVVLFKENVDYKE